MEGKSFFFLFLNVVSTHNGRWSTCNPDGMFSNVYILYLVVPQVFGSNPHTLMRGSNARDYFNLVYDFPTNLCWQEIKEKKQTILIAK